MGGRQGPQPPAADLREREITPVALAEHIRIPAQPRPSTRPGRTGHIDAAVGDDGFAARSKLADLPGATLEIVLLEAAPRRFFNERFGDIDDTAYQAATSTSSRRAISANPRASALESW